MNATIKKTISIGDAGTPFNLSIYVEYDQKDNCITVTYCMEDDCPYDNPPESWYGRIKDVISDFFYEQNDKCNVVFT